MQAQSGFEKTSMLQTLSKVVKNEGVKGLYRGCIPPLWGSGLWRSIQFSAFEATLVSFLCKKKIANMLISLIFCY